MDWSKERLYKTVAWSNLTKLGKSRIIQSSFVWLLIVPAVAKILSPLDSVGQDQTFVISGTELTIHIGLPFSWKLFYVSAVFLTVASLLYQRFCPRLIKDLDGNRHSAATLKFPTLEYYGTLMGETRDSMQATVNIDRAVRANDLPDQRAPCGLASEG